MAYNNKVKVASHMGKHGDHPVGGAVGAAAGALTGAIIVGATQGAIMGTAGGLPGMAAGVAIGGVVGALAGKAVAEDVNPTMEDIYWSENYSTRDYIENGVGYNKYRSAYHHGIDSYGKYEGRKFDDVEPQIREDWEVTRGDFSMPWVVAKPAVRDAYNRLKDRLNDNVKL